MLHTGRKVTYSEDELEEFYPLWTLLAEDRELEREALRLRELLLFADEEALCNGSSPLLPDLNQFSQTLCARVGEREANWTPERLRAFQFYCFWHNGRDGAFDFEHERRQALERKNAAWLAEREQRRGG